MKKLRVGEIKNRIEIVSTIKEAIKKEDRRAKIEETRPNMLKISGLGEDIYWIEVKVVRGN
jgi:hypothetical protein